MDLVVYHGGCPDGFCAAFIAKKRWPDAELLPATYGQDPPIREVYEKNVLVVDFSWSRGICERLAHRARSFTILDHHKTAEAELVGLDYATFDMNRSGASLTWDTLFPGQLRPWYVSYVEDRDLWKWQLPDSKEINAYLMVLNHTIEAWKQLDTMTFDSALSYGIGARVQVEHYVERITEHPARGMFDGYSAALVCAGYPNCSDVGDVLCRNADVGVVWFERADGLLQFSLRSRGETDVSALAKTYGGGGHKNAAGFQVPYLEGRTIVDRILGRKASE